MKAGRGKTANLSDLGARDSERKLAELATPLLRYFARRTATQMDAEDCLAEALLVLWRRRGDVPANADELRPYAFGVARLVLQNHVRSTQRRNTLQAALIREVRIDYHRGPTDADLLVRQMLAALSDSDRELITLVHWDGLSVVDAGASMGLRSAAAHKRHARAMQRLRTMLLTQSSQNPFDELNLV